MSAFQCAQRVKLTRFELHSHGGSGTTKREIFHPHLFFHPAHEFFPVRLNQVLSVMHA